jgi:hypothetical protein
MKLDETTKIVSIVSVVVGLTISVAGYFANSKLQSLQESINKLNIDDKKMDASKKAYDLSARLMLDFSLPLARSFALQYSPGQSSKATKDRHVSMATTEIAEEFAKVLGGWEERRGLMTGQACAEEGLKARQVVTLLVRNIGHADAIDIEVKAMQKKSANPDPTKPWQELSDKGTPLAYYDLLSAKKGWTPVTIPVGSLRGLSSPAEHRIPEQIVLASVSGTRSLFGTIIVPIEVSWTDNISKNRQSMPILSAHAAVLRADLLGAEIGSIGSACR